ncbi:hypothetical protein KI387_002666 [Taxus chinensis]|uniref:Uncharacterized protein n=1 Tax=Taxus chinensis TaxID=29808 RepID=A0AA38LMH2_TAXCH|nr:hypothetical protein KI387_002666 [Taxus chinensis]
MDKPQGYPIAVGGVKRGHVSDHSNRSDSDQDVVFGSFEPRSDSNNLMMVVASYSGQWQEVKKKKR